MDFADKALRKYDVFHFHWGSTLSPGNADLPLLAQRGKRLFMNFWGLDCRQWSLAREMNPFIRVKTADEVSIRNRLELLAEYIPIAVVADYELHRYVLPFFDKIIQVPQAIVTDHYPVMPFTERGKLVIVHAPTNPYVKGTNEIMVALRKLGQEGYKFSIRLISGIAHEEARKHYAQADVIIDSITEGVYGLFAIECMSMGKPVIGWLTDEAKEFYLGVYGMEPPMITANPLTIYDVLKSVLQGKIDLDTIRKLAPQYVRDNHDYLKVAAKLKEIYVSQ